MGSFESGDRAQRKAELTEEVLLSLAGDRASLAPEIIASRFEANKGLAKTVGEQIVRWGLALPADGSEPPLLLTAGQQYLRRRGAVSIDTLLFLSRWIDDLDAREALRQGTHALVGELHAAFTNGDPVETARSMVPPAFEAAVDRALAVRLYAAAAALAARLGEGAPPACVAEEILLVWVLDYAEQARGSSISPRSGFDKQVMPSTECSNSAKTMTC